MRKKLLPIVLLFGALNATAQVGIGTTTPNKSAELLIQSDSRGLLIPNVALTDTKDKTTITNGNVQSLLVYATQNAGDITPGYYYWDVDKWSRLTASQDIPQIVADEFKNILDLDGGKVADLIKDLIVFNETLTVLGYEKATNTLTYKDENGATQKVELNNTSLELDAASGKLKYTNSKGETVLISFPEETLTVLGYEKATNTLTYKDENGATQKVELNNASLEVDTTTGNLKFTDSKGKITEIPLPGEVLTKLSYEPKTNKITYTDENGADKVLELNNTSFSFDPATKKITYTNSKGETLDFTLPGETLTVLGYVEGTNTLTYKDENGDDKVVQLNTTALVYDSASNKLTYTDSKGQSNDIQLKGGDTVTIKNELKLEGNKLTSTVNGESSSVELTDENIVSTKGITGTGITVVGGEKSTLKDVTLSITPGEEGEVLVTKGGKTVWEIAAGSGSGEETLTVLGYSEELHELYYTDEKGKKHTVTLKTSKLEYNPDTNQLIFTAAKGDSKTIQLDGGSSTFAADNGLTKTDNNVQLGGTLIKPTVITAGAKNTLAVAGLQDAKITDYIVMADKDGVLKQLKAAMPKFFYMPSIVMPTAPDQISADLTPNVTVEGDVYTANLYANYTSQFGTPAASSDPAVKLPVLPASELVYNITWFDKTVFTDVNITDDGILTYKILPNADVTIGSFMNIVFAVK